MTTPTKRGINLGCGKVIMPCEKPEHHIALPDFLYTSPDIQWHNADWNQNPGVTHMLDLFDYPWRTEAALEVETTNGKASIPTMEPLPSNTYDYAVASHIVEHIPHHIVENGQFVARHPQWQDGFFYWFGELNRILKPGGKAFILVPYAWSNSGISDPTHTRYITPATFNYLTGTDDSPFTYRNAARWEPIDYERDMAMVPHQQAAAQLKMVMGTVHLINALLTGGVLQTDAAWLKDEAPTDDLNNLLYTAYVRQLSGTNLNMLVEFSIVLTKAGVDEDHSEKQSTGRIAVDAPEAARLVEAGAASGEGGLVRSGAPG